MSSFKERYEAIQERYIREIVNAHINDILVASLTKEGFRKLKEMNLDAENLLREIYDSDELTSDERMDLADRVTRLNRAIRNDLFLLRD